MEVKFYPDCLALKRTKMTSFYQTSYLQTSKAHTDMLTDMETQKHTDIHHT